MGLPCPKPFFISEGFAPSLTARAGNGMLPNKNWLFIARGQWFGKRFYCRIRQIFL